MGSKTVEIRRGEAKNTGTVIVREEGVFMPTILDIAGVIIHNYLENLKNTIKISSIDRIQILTNKKLVCILRGTHDILQFLGILKRRILTRTRVFEILRGEGEQITDDEIREVLVCMRILEP